MLQDLSYGTLDNQYHSLQPQPEDLVVCIRDRSVLLWQDGAKPVLPIVSQVDALRTDWEQWLEEPYRYLFTLQGRRWFLWMGRAGAVEEEGFVSLPVTMNRDPRERDFSFGLMTAWHLYCWYRDSRFCGRCGHATLHDDKERMMRCPVCGNMIFPRISPAAIIAFTHGDKLMLIKYANREYTHYGLLAGFIEIGETAEEAVIREVMEEVGLKARNVRYYKSQPWGIVGNLSVGYFCELDGEDDLVTLDEDELSVAQWFSRDAIPYTDEGISLTGEMIRVFAEGKEPR